MKGLKLTASILSLLGLIACGGGGEDEDGGNSKYANAISWTIPDTSSNASIQNRLLLGSSHDIGDSLTIPVIVDPDYDVYQGIGSRLDTAVSLANIEIAAAYAVGNTHGITNVDISATSDNDSIIAIENGKVVAKAAGKTNLTYTVSIQSDISNTVTSTFSQEMVVCPHSDIMLYSGGFEYSNSNSPLQITGFNEISVTAMPLIDQASAAAAGLTTTDCPVDVEGPQNAPYESVYAGSHTVLNGGLYTTGNFGNGTQLYLGQDAHGTAASSEAPKLLGLDFSHITINRVQDNLTNVRITKLGFDNKIVAESINPIEILAYSPDLQKDVDVASFYIDEETIHKAPGLPIFREGCSGSVEIYGYCTLGASTVNISLDANNTHTSLVAVTNEQQSVIDGTIRTDLSAVSGLPGTALKVSSVLTADGKQYDVSEFGMFPGGYNGNSLFVLSQSFSGTSQVFANYIIPISSGLGSYHYETSTNSVSYAIGQPTSEDIRGRWLRVDSGEDHYISLYSPLNYQEIDANQLTYQDASNNTITLVRAGIDNVALSGSVNIVEEVTAQALSITPQPRSLSGIASIDLILKNVTSGEETAVSVAADGTFNESVETGIYDVEGTVVDGEITYDIGTVITVEKDATDTGKLNLAKVGLYNFDVSITGCKFDYKCYAGKQYTFTVKAFNTGFIASSGLQATFGDISDHANVTAFNVSQSPITGAAPGDSIDYQFTATFSQPAQDTIIEVPVTLKDVDNRTWEDVVKITLSQYDPLDVNILAYNAGTPAQVRGYLMLEGRTPIRVSGTDSTITVPNKPGATYELILANQEYNAETPYAVANNTSISESDFDGFNELGRNENADDTAAGAQAVNNGEKFVSYISAGDVDHYTINVPAL